MPSQVKDEYVTDREDLTRRNILDGDPFVVTTPSWRFRKDQVEPYMPSLAPGALGAGCVNQKLCEAGGRLAVLASQGRR